MCNEIKCAIKSTVDLININIYKQGCARGMLCKQVVPGMYT